MRKLIIAAAGAAAFALAAVGGAAPAFAETLKEVTTHGIILTLGDMDIPVTYTPDGKFSAMDGAVTGTWRIDGEKLCTSSTADPTETCVAYPKDKKSGDTFMLDTPNGSVQIKIR
jgi:hypothetical protein